MDAFKREMLSGCIGGLGFILVFLVGKNISVALVIGIVLGIGTYLFIGKQKSQVQFQSDGTAEDEFKKLLTQSNHNLGQLTVCRRKIIGKVEEQDKEMLPILDDIIGITKSILSSITANPKYFENAKPFITYYLPSIVTIVEKYTQIAVNDVDTEEGLAFQSTVKDFLKEVKTAFEKQKQFMFQDDMLNASVDMEVLKNILKTNGLLDNQDFTHKS